MSALGHGVMESIRNAAVAGQFYPGNEKSLKQQIEECFLDKRGFGEIPSLKKVRASLKRTRSATCRIRLFRCDSVSWLCSSCRATDLLIRS